MRLSATVAPAVRRSRGTPPSSPAILPALMKLASLAEFALGLTWQIDEAAMRTSHALLADGRVWLVDPVDQPEAMERVAALGEPAAVVQLIDRHNRDCASIAQRLGVPHLRMPDAVPDSPFEAFPVLRLKR